MSVQVLQNIAKNGQQIGFNTSYVSVQGVTALANNAIKRMVSIHPMCRFKHLIKCYPIFIKLVSIHPMCRFKSFAEAIFVFTTKVSIHPMCRFKYRERGY